ncbi:MAG: hypothetical protein MUO76_13580 [Anaerolineaceae bacterium]|nr:hypothetical protein [Anaerolineaceae bacterium]
MFVSILIVAGYLYVLISSFDPEVKENFNVLAIGRQALLESIKITLNEPVDLNQLTREEIYTLREEAVDQYPWLVVGNYLPSYDVFSGIEGQVPWWGTKGHFFYGSGDRSIEGPAEESRFIMNPYLLVAAEFPGLSIWTNRHSGQFWNNQIISEQTLDLSNFPLYIKPEKLEWWPVISRAEVTYDVSGYLKIANDWTEHHLGVPDAYFDLITYNARDLNLNYLYLSYEDSFSVYKRDSPPGAVPLKHYLHRGDSCDYPGGCNNMSPYTPEIMDIRITRLPARAIIYLWKEKPESISQEPDMTFVINIK